MSKRYRGKACCVVNCGNTQINTENIQFYSFSRRPHKAKQRKKWITAVRRINEDGSEWQPNEHTRICSAHFIDNAKSDHPFSPSFVPSIFPPCYLEKNPSVSFISSAKRRFNKYLEVSIDEKVQPETTNTSKSPCVTSLEDLNESQLDYPFKIEGSDDATTPKFVDIGIQVYSVSEDFNDNCNLLVCNRFVIDNVCEVQIQTNLQLMLQKNFSCNSAKVSDKCCGSNIT